MSTAAVNAPQPLCPSTTTSFRLSLRRSVAYFRLPSTSGPSALPATRMTNSSFGPSLKISSTGTRASAQPTTAAKGRCSGALVSPTEVARVDGHDPLHPLAAPLMVVEEGGKTPVARIKPLKSGLAVGGPRHGRRPRRLAAVDDVDRRHVA